MYYGLHYRNKQCYIFWKESWKEGRRKGETLGASIFQCLAEQLTLYQPGGQIMPTTVLQAPSNFQTLRRPCHGKPKISSIFHYERMPDVSIASVFWAHKDIQKMLLQKSFYPIILSFPTSHWRQIKFLEERLDSSAVNVFPIDGTVEQSHFI